MIFRWAIGDVDTCSMFYFDDEAFQNYLRLSKTSILSFQLQFPDADFYVFYNGLNYQAFKEAFASCRPTLLKEVKLVNAREYANPYHFEPHGGVWWKWVPFRLDINKTEIHVDSDLICVGRPNFLINELENGNHGLIVTTDICPEFTPWVVGNMYDTYYETLLKGRIPINAGFLVMKPGVDISEHFYETSLGVEYDANWQFEHQSGTNLDDDEIAQRRRNTNFIDEQGCLNVAIYKSDIPFVILPRDINIYGHEIFDRLDRGVEVELCHFISGTKRIFLDFEHQFFTKLNDKLYTVKQFRKDICVPQEQDFADLGLGHLTEDQVSHVLEPDASFDEFQDWVPKQTDNPDPRYMDWTGRGPITSDQKAKVRLAKYLMFPYYDPGLIIKYPPGDGVYGMKVISSTVKLGEWADIETTGAYFHFTSTGVDIYQKIKTTNDGTFPQGAVLAAQMTFADEVSAPIVPSVNAHSAFVSMGDIQFQVNADSFVQFITSKPLFTYHYENKLNCEWIKGYMEHRMWNSGRGGTIHGGNSLHLFADIQNRISVIMPFNAKGFFAVFPSKRFNFDKLYGTNARPHAFFAYSYDQLPLIEGQFSRLENDKFGVICLFAGFYTESHEPVFNESTQRYEYQYSNPQAIQSFVHNAHQHGFKVIAYLQCGAMDQPWNFTLDWMRQHQSDYNLDGWYFDNARVGNWDETHEFVRLVRQDVGDDGVLFHHDSVDVWGYWNGSVFTPVDCYMDYTLKGETGTLAEVDNPHHPYLKYYSQGYGLSQSLATHKLRSNGSAPLEQKDLMRALAYNYNGTQRAALGSQLDQWEIDYLPYYQHRKDTYLNTPYYFVPDPRDITWWNEVDVNVTLVGDTITLQWQTGYLPTDATVKWTLEDDFNDNRLYDDNMSTSHIQSIMVEPGNTVKIFIRSATDDPFWYHAFGKMLTVHT